MYALTQRLRDIRLLRYLLASIGALAVDVGCFLAAMSSGITPAAASAFGYCAGIVAHWLLSSRTVFTDTVGRGSQRTRQKVLFVLSALLGLLATTLIVGGGDALSIDPRLAKLFAIAVSFALTWLVRSRIVFR